MGKNLVETVMGAVVLAVAIGFVAIAYTVGDLKTIEGYSLISKFDRVDGLVVGADVRMSGIKVGTVVKQELDPETYLAVVTINVKSEIKLPRDTSAQISSDGLLGDKYLSLQAGAEDDMLKPGQEIEYTQGSVDIVSLVGRMMFSQTGEKKDGGGKQDGGK